MDNLEEIDLYNVDNYFKDVEEVNITAFDFHNIDIIP